MGSQRQFESNGVRVSGVIFDCDGTLVDSELMQAKALQKALAEMGINVELDELERLSGIDNSTVLRNIEAQRGLTLPRDLEANIEGLAHGLLSEGIQAMDGAVEVVRALARDDLLLAVASNSRRDLVTGMLAAVGLLDPFQGRIATRDLVRAPKPAPDVYLLAARMAAIAPDRCLAVEDSPAGVSSARRAGMAVVAGYCSASGPYQNKDLLEAGATLIIDDLRALPRIIAQSCIGGGG